MRYWDLYSKNTGELIWIGQSNYRNVVINACVIATGRKWSSLREVEITKEEYEKLKKENIGT